MNRRRRRLERRLFRMIGNDIRDDKTGLVISRREQARSLVALITSDAYMNRGRRTSG